MLIGMYHARVDVATEDRLVQGFASGVVRCMVATIAFSLGIDVPDVRHVFLPGFPRGIISLYKALFSIWKK